VLRIGDRDFKAAQFSRQSKAEKGEGMAKKIYVGNMSYSTSEDSIRSLFASYGEVVSVNLITDRFTGESKGFGFVEMAQDEQASAAISALNGRELDGRQLRVDVAQDKPRGDSRSGGYNRRRY
jgi:RNA recognition motif-containing protein